MSLSVTVADLRVQRPGFTLGPLSFAVPTGGRLAIVGPSGCGKTTLLRCLAGLDRASAGTIRVGDRIVADAHTHAAPDRRGLQLVFQDGALWPHMTAAAHLTFAAPGLSRDAAVALLARGGLQAHADKKPAQLSGGEAQRLGLLRALAPDPSVLLLDEPLRSVDVHQRDAMVLLLRTLADERKLTTILVTHDRDEALALATDLVVLHEGQLVEQGPALRLLQQPACAFTAAFLLGASCLPTTTSAAGVATPFGTFARPSGELGDLRLVILPGELRAEAAPGSGPTARVLTVAPGKAGFTLRLALGDHLVSAHCDTALPIGSTAHVALTTAPRLLPWQRRATPASVQP